jgi:hypothetical protein
MRCHSESNKYTMFTKQTQSEKHEVVEAVEAQRIEANLKKLGKRPGEELTDAEKYAVYFDRV